MVPIKADARDTTCCCFGWVIKRRSLRTQLYINSNGVAERFDHQKATNEGKALRRAMRNLNKVIRRTATLENRNIVDVLDQIAYAVGVPLNDENPIPLTLELMKKINAAVEAILL